MLSRTRRMYCVEHCKTFQIKNVIIHPTPTHPIVQHAMFDSQAIVALEANDLKFKAFLLIARLLPRGLGAELLAEPMIKDSFFCRRRRLELFLCKQQPFLTAPVLCFSGFSEGASQAWTQQARRKMYRTSPCKMLRLPDVGGQQGAFGPDTQQRQRQVSCRHFRSEFIVHAMDRL